MSRKVPDPELSRTEAACNALASLETDHRPLIRALEEHYGANIKEHRIRRIVGGGAGSEQILLFEETEQQSAT